MMTICTKCEGEGKLYDDQPTKISYGSETCRECGGSGKIESPGFVVPYGEIEDLIEGIKDIDPHGWADSPGAVKFLDALEEHLQKHKPEGGWPS